MLKIGLTGGIGSGKSTIAKIFFTLGIPVYDADSAAKKLMVTSPQIKQGIIETFGEEAYIGGQLNRPYIASIVFNNEEKLKQLNNITHPVTIQDSVDWFNMQDAPYAIKEAALIFESDSHKHLDYVIGVYSPEKLRIERTMKRDNITEEKVRERINKQMNEEQKMKLCDFVIDNSGTQSVIEQVYQLHIKLMQTAAQHQ